MIAPPSDQEFRCGASHECQLVIHEAACASLSGRLTALCLVPMGSPVACSPLRARLYVRSRRVGAQGATAATRGAHAHRTSVNRTDRSGAHHNMVRTRLRSESCCQFHKACGAFPLAKAHALRVVPLICIAAMAAAHECALCLHSPGCTQVWVPFERVRAAEWLRGGAGRHVRCGQGRRVRTRVALARHRGANSAAGAAAVWQEALSGGNAGARCATSRLLSVLRPVSR